MYRKPIKVGDYFKSYDDMILDCGRRKKVATVHQPLFKVVGKGKRGIWHVENIYLKLASPTAIPTSVLRLCEKIDRLKAELLK